MTPEDRVLKWVEGYGVTIDSTLKGASDALIQMVEDAINEEREACAVASENWTEGRSRFVTAASAIRARKPLK